MKAQVQVEIVAYAPTAFYHCTHCEVSWREIGMSNTLHEEQVSSSLPQDLAEDYQAMSDWVRDLFRRHCEGITVKVIDAVSVEGIWKTARHGLRRFPAIIVDRKKSFDGGNFQAAEAEIARRLAAAKAIGGETIDTRRMSVAAQGDEKKEV